MQTRPIQNLSANENNTVFKSADENNTILNSANKSNTKHERTNKTNRTTHDRTNENHAKQNFKSTVNAHTEGPDDKANGEKGSVVRVDLRQQSQQFS